MYLSEAVALAEARSFIAALADTAEMPTARVEYELALIELDSLYDNIVPPITVVPSPNRAVTYRIAHEAVARLGQHGLDAFDLAVCTCRLSGAWAAEHPSGPNGQNGQTGPSPADPTSNGSDEWDGPES